ncbi:glycoside hydrolase family 3 protein [Edaphobacillus lindanitolerans]|uniref:beta-N-acetylhexosaminidase n=1 Tax=Edaphobacillus lindanitolerans TaxID=550447 RepID=A0A1U7PN99_9BACI|nr:beta-N-acetylhexosaminidase [Edaphobacillus lindanitolerans]
MRKFKKLLMVPLLAALSLTPMATGVNAAVKPDASDLVILQNVPEMDTRIGEDGLQLTALRVYDDGHFVKTDDVEWTTSNGNVATVDGAGNVTVTGKPGKTFIGVKDGDMSDRIAVQAKPDPGARTGKGKPPVVASLVKEGGDRHDLIGHAISQMTMEEKVGQMLMPDFRTWKGKNVTEMLPEIERLVKDYHLGGVILFRENVVTTEQTTRLADAYQAASDKYGMFLTIDQEGGIVTRLQSGTDMPGNMALGATRSPELAYDTGRVIGEELASLGINFNLAPSLDINNNPDNPVIGVRSFGEDPELVAELGISYVKGVQDTGTAATVKHFPGHGDTAVDSHLGLPEVPYDKERLMEVELMPFRKAMDEGVDALLTAHVTFPKIDDTKVISKKDGTEINLPATLSHKVLTELVREEMGYEGLIFTDALNMQAIADHFGPVDAVIKAIQAGTDIVLMPVGLEDVANGVYDAVRSGEISEERIEASVARILELKLKRGILKEENPESLDEKISNALEVVGSDEHKEIERQVAEKSVTLVKNDSVLPLAPAADDRIVVVGNTYIEDLYGAVKEKHENTVLIKTTGPLTEEQLDQVRAAKAVVAGTVTSTVAQRSPDNAQMRMVNQLKAETETPVIAAGIRNPYDIMAYPDVDAYLAQYSFRTASFRATAGILFGEVAPSGLLPVTIPGTDGGVLYGYGHGLTY